RQAGGQRGLVRAPPRRRARAHRGAARGGAHLRDAGEARRRRPQRQAGAAGAPRGSGGAPRAGSRPPAQEPHSRRGGRAAWLAARGGDALWGLGVARAALGRDESAIETLEGAVRVPSATSQVNAKLDELVVERAAALEARGEHAAALPYRLRARELGPDDPAR